MLNCRQVATWQTSGFTKLKKDNRTKKMVERKFVNRPESFTAIIELEEPPTDEQIAAAVKEEFELVLTVTPGPPAAFDDEPEAVKPQLANGFARLQRDFNTSLESELRKVRFDIQSVVNFAESAHDRRRFLCMDGH